MGKRIVICCDGTGNHLNETYSNVIKLYMCLAKDDNQVAFYDPGVGTMADPNVVTPLYKWISKIGGLAFGWGLRANVGDAYKFLMANYVEGDHVFIFGFSRGAYTSRVLAGMVHAVGLLFKGSDHLFPYAWNAYTGCTDPKGKTIARNFKKIYSRKMRIHFVGVWDTVTSVGLFGLTTKPFTTRNVSVQNFRHAISIDERRSFYRQNLFQPTHRQSVKQVWFAGVHSDVGGSYALKESGLSQVALQWMIDEASDFKIKMDTKMVSKLLHDVREVNHSLPSATGKLHRSLSIWWWPLEFLPKLRRSFPWMRLPNFGRRRDMHFNSRGFPAVPVIHWSVEERIEMLSDYRPSNLVGKPYQLEPKRK